MAGVYRIFGAEVSPYSVKVRSYFRYKGIPHEWIERSRDTQEEYQKYARLPLIPAVATPDGRGLQDSTPILETLEAEFPELSIHPPDPALAFVSALLEEFGDEWGNKWMFHYRWARPADQDSAAERIARSMRPDLAGAELAQMAAGVKERMVGRVWFVGSGPGTSMMIEASYRDYTCEFDRATRLLRRAERLQIRFGTPNAVAVIRILRAEPARRTGRLIEAIDLLQSALGLLDVRDQPRLAIMAVHNLGHCLIDAGAFDAALGILRRFKPAYETFAKPRDRALRTLLEARSVRGAGLVSLAEAMLMEARDRLVELASPYEVVTVDLDLAELYAVENRWTELETIAGETLALCTAYGVGTEALAAAKLLCDAAERRQVTAGNVLGLVARLRDHLAPLTRLA